MARHQAYDIRFGSVVGRAYYLAHDGLLRIPYVHRDQEETLKYQKSHQKGMHARAERQSS